MTKEEILAMEAGVELDALVLREVFGCNVEIKAMGWNEDGGPRFCYCCCDDTSKQGQHRDWEHHYGAAISSSADISATWLALRKLREEFWCIEIRIADGCRVIMELLGTPPIKVEVNAGTPFEKLPEAICKAALLAKLEVKS